MSAVDLWRELIAARADRRVDDILERHGVTDSETRLHCGLAKIRTAGRFYECDVDGEYAIIVPVVDGDDLIDSLAFDPRQPEKWWLRLSEACLLGIGALDGLYLGAELQVCRNPLSWLQNHATGCVVLDWPRAADRLRSIATLLAEDIGYAQDIRCRLQKPLPIPDIRVTTSALEGAD